VPKPSLVVQKMASGSDEEGHEARRQAAFRSTTPARLARQFRGDLDNIVLRATNRAPERRYPSALALREDLDRFRDHRPVRARPDSWVYRTSRFLSRHRLGVAIACVTATVLVAALWVAVDGRLRAQREASLAGRVSQLLVEVFRAPDVSYGNEGNIPASALLDDAVVRLRAELGEETGLYGRMAQAIAESYANLGEYPAAERLLRQTLEGIDPAWPTGSPPRAPLERSLATVLVTDGRLDEGEEILRASIAGQRGSRRRDQDTLAMSLNELGRLLWLKGENEESEAVLLEALELARQAAGADPAARQRYLRVLNALAVTTVALERVDQGAELYRQILLEQREFLDEPHPDIATALNNLAKAERLRGDLDAAERLYREALDQRRQLYGNEHADVAQSLNNVAAIAYYRGDHAVALELWEEAAETMIAAHDGGDHPRIASVLSNVGSASRHLGETAKAVDSLGRAEAMFARMLGADNPQTARAGYRLATALQDAARYEEAEERLRRALEVQLDALGPNHQQTVDSWLSLAELLTATGRSTAARRLLDQALTRVDDPDQRARLEAADG
jgi:serine/threonine-protein kinase